MKKQNIQNFLKPSYNIKDTFLLSSSLSACATCVGMKNKSEKVKKHKIKEGAFQFFNTSFCSIGALGFLKLSEKIKPLNKNPIKIVSILVGIVSGMILAFKTTNKLFNKENAQKRDFKVKDCISSVDDILSALIIAKIPLANNLHLSNLLPIIYSYCGYRAGSAESTINQEGNKK